MLTRHEVTFSVQFKTTITLNDGVTEDGQTLHEAIADIDIPENEDCSYVENTFEVQTVTN